MLMVSPHFIDADFAGQSPSLTGEQGREILRFALAAQESGGMGGGATVRRVDIVMGRRQCSGHKDLARPYAMLWV